MRCMLMPSVFVFYVNMLRWKLGRKLIEAGLEYWLIESGFVRFILTCKDWSSVCERRLNMI